ncbi:caspase domain-containing protein [Mycena galopus ATCC 62051]|nr:caspase domain-containing protein [Mycena galopus ATCC 62051]
MQAREADARALSSVSGKLEENSCSPSQYIGQKKALLIAIEDTTLRKAHNDVYRMRDLLLEVYHYTLAEITILVDDETEGHVRPTRDNILASIAELVKDVKNGDRLCFHFAGTGLPLTTQELHDTLVRPLPFGSHLVAVLDTSNSGSMLDLKHFRCNRIYVPWIFRGWRNIEDMRNVIVRRNAQLLAVPQTKSPRTFALARETGSGATPKPGYVSRLRTGSKTSRVRLRTLALSTPSATKHKEQGTNNGHAERSWILPDQEVVRCESPVEAVLCNGWCRDRERISPVMEDGDEMKADGITLPGKAWILPDEEVARCESPKQFYDEMTADVISLASCRDSQITWESTVDITMTSSLVDILREEPCLPLQDVLFRISHASYSRARTRYPNAEVYKVLHRRQHKAYSSDLERKIKILTRQNQSTSSVLYMPPVVLERSLTFPPVNERGPRKMVQAVSKQIAFLKRILRSVRKDDGYAIDSSQIPELSSPRPLDMNRPWMM